MSDPTLESPFCCEVCRKTLAASTETPPERTLVEIYNRQDLDTMGVQSIWLRLCWPCWFRGRLASGPNTILKVMLLLGSPVLGIFAAVLGTRWLAADKPGLGVIALGLLVGVVAGAILVPMVQGGIIRWFLRERRTRILERMNASSFGITTNLRVH